MCGFDNAPAVNFFSPISYSSRAETISPSKDADDGGRKDHEAEAREMLASATRDGFDPPFRALVYQVNLSHPLSLLIEVWYSLTWASHRSGRTAKVQSGARPLPDEHPVHPTRMPQWGARDDPVTSGVIDLATARTLYTLSMDRRPSLLLHQR